MSISKSLLQAQPAQEEAVRSTRVPLIAYVRDRETQTILADVLAPVLGTTSDFRVGDVTETRAGLQRLDTPWRPSW